MSTFEGHVFVAQAYLQLIVVGFLRGEGEEARAFSRLVEGVISTLGERPDLERQRLRHRKGG